MISVESHSKQIKLLNDYILALERELNALKREAEESHKQLKTGGDEGLRLRGENQQLKARVGKAEQELKRFVGLEQEYFRLREFMEREEAEKQALLANLKELNANNKSIYDRMQEQEAELQAAATRQAQAQAQLQLKEQKCGELTAEVERLGKENSQLKGLLDKKINENATLNNSINLRAKDYDAKAKDYDAYVRRTNDEKANLIRILRSLEDEKKDLEAANAATKGDANETARALATQAKRVQELTSKLDAAQGEIASLRAVKGEAETMVGSLRRELETTYRAKDMAVREKEEAQERESETLRLKFNGEAFFNNQIAKLEDQIAKLTQQLEEASNTIKTRTKTTNALEEELKELKAEYGSFRNQSASLSDSHTSEVELVRAKLREGERKNALNQEKIESMVQEIRELQIHFQNEHHTLQLSQAELERTKQSFQREIAELNQLHQEALRKKGDELAHALLEGQALADKLTTTQETLRSKEAEVAAGELRLRETVKRLEAERDQEVERLNSASLSSMLETQARARKETELEALRIRISSLEATLKEQAQVAQALTRRLAEREREIEGLEESNAALRKQAISSIANEEASKRELLDVKSKAGSVMGGSVMGGSRVRSTVLMRGSAADARGVRFNTAASNIVRSGSSDKRSFNKKRTTPAQPRFSMVEGEVEVTAESEELLE